MTEVRPVGRELSKASNVSALLRVVLVLDPNRTEPMARPARSGVEVKLHLAALDTIRPSAQFLARADMLVVEVDPSKPQQIEHFSKLVADLAERMPVVAACRALTVADTRRLIREGAVDVLPLPMTEDDFSHAIEQASRFHAPRAAPIGRQGKVVSFLGAVGGAGATVMATQAGALWAAEERSICLIDFDIQFGSAALYLDMKPQLNVVDLLDAGERLDIDVLQTVATKHESGLHVVAGPSEMMPLDVLTPVLATQVLAIARQCFDIVLVDLPSAWTNWSMTVLSQSDAIMLVTAHTVPGIHQARRKLDLLDANNMACQVVLNRVAKLMFRTIDLGDTEKVLRRKVDFVIANDYPTVSGAIDQGRTLAAIKGKSRVEKDIADMVETMTTLLAGAPVE